ncbi:hypothetical protein ASF35_11915 [Aeromicrobium sp. Leaf291]|nr:hypothetical protein ASF35_11915 [Aeromicrobium sp. Leaf291]
MLFHPSASMQDHFEGAARILSWAHDETLEQGRQRVGSGERALPVDRITEDIRTHESEWSAWISEYAQTASELTDALGELGYPTPELPDWPEIKRLLVEELVPAAHIAVVNSDPASDDRPRFSPILGADGWQCSPNSVTIFVAGNVMSRGLTLEGLTTTLFLRPSDNPVADTQSQMQRWFGFRGGHLDVVRLFAEQTQINLFRAYHDADEALRRQVISEMGKQSAAPHPVVLEAEDFKATSKIADVRSVSAWPGSRPFIDLVNRGVTPDPNTRLAVDVFSTRTSHHVEVHGPRGRMLDTPISLAEAADLLDRLRYDDYVPSPDGWQGARWRAVESQLFTDSSDPGGLRPFFRTPAKDSATVDFAAERPRCPYSTAAYLRLWAAALSTRSNYFVATGSTGEHWSMVDLSEKRAQQPRFNIGLRFGGGAPTSAPPFNELDFPVPLMTRAVRDGVVPGGWGSHNAGEWAGDEWFDLYALKESPSHDELRTGTRAPGRPGLILFNITRPEGLEHPVTAVGIALPLGGPNQVAARGPS